MAVLLTIHAGLATHTAWQTGLSFDEGLQLAVGYNLWLHADYRMEGANGDLIKRWATLPFLVLQPRFVAKDEPAWQAGEAYELGRQFLFELGNSPVQLLAASRFMNMWLGVATCGLVFLFARRLFGTEGGLVALLLAVFSPHLLAFGGLVSTDLAITLTLLASTHWSWRLLHEITVGRLGVSLVWAGLAVLAKPTAAVLFPLVSVMILVRLGSRRPLVLAVTATPHRIHGRGVQVGVILLLLLLHVTAGWAAIWGHYSFRFEASPEPGNPQVKFYQPQTQDGVPAGLAAGLNWLHHQRVLPEGYLRGLENLLSCDDELGAFAGGRWRLGGWYWFFPYAIAVKTHAGVLFLLLTAGATWWVVRRRLGRRAGSVGAYEATPWLTLIGGYLGLAMTEDINLGLRHVLPIYPAAYILCGAVTLARGPLSVWSRRAVFFVLGWVVLDVGSNHPNHLGYFGPQVGGAAEGYRYLVDSSCDWGSSLPALKRWLEKSDPAGHVPLYLAYFGADDPGLYGIRAQRLPGFFERRTFAPFPLAPGHYAISASLLQSVYTTAFGPWNRTYEDMYRRLLGRVVEFDRLIPDPNRRQQLLLRPEFAELADDIELFDNLRFARLCAWLRHRKRPMHQVAHGVLVWRLTYEDLAAALLREPAELTDEPARIRRYRFVGAVAP